MRFSGSVVDQGQRRASSTRAIPSRRRQGARGRAVGARALLPPRRHAAVAGRPGLRAQGSAALVHRRQRHRGRPLPADHHGRGRRRTTTASTTPTSAIRSQPNVGAPVKPVVEAGRRRVRAVRQPAARRCSCAPTATRRTARSSPSTCSNPDADALEDDRPRAPSRRSRTSRVIGGRLVVAVPRRRAEPAAAVRARRRSAGRDRAARHRRGWRRSAAAQDSPTCSYSFTLAARARPRSIATTRRRSKSAPFEAAHAADRHRAASRRRRCSRRRRTARACRSS